MPAAMFEEFLNKKGFKFEQKEVDGKIMFIIPDYKIPFGKYSDKIVQIGIPIPKDFPNSGPYGLHIKKDHGFEESIPRQNPSPLGSEWEFWSREIKWDNPAYRTAQYYFDHINRWLELN